MYGGLSNVLKEQMKSVYRRDQRYWSRRPITREMLLYAGGDVLGLVPQVYTAMNKYDFHNCGETFSGMWCS